MIRVLHFDYKHHGFVPIHDKLREALEATGQVEYSYLKSVKDGAPPFIPPNKRRLEALLGETDVLLIAPGMMDFKPEKQETLEGYLAEHPQLRIGILTPDTISLPSPDGYQNLPETLPTFAYMDTGRIVAYVLEQQK